MIFSKEPQLKERITLLRIFLGDDEVVCVQDTDLEPDPDHDPDPGARCLNIDDYWAGRNRAMRRSARSAA